MTEKFPPPNSDHHAPVISRRWKHATVAGNLLLGSAELLSGNLQSLSVAADGVHNVGDAVTYAVQSDDVLQPDRQEEQLAKRRKAMHWIIAASSGLVAAKAGYDLTQETSHTANNVAVITASLSCIYNGALYHRLRQGIKREHTNATMDCHRENDLKKHLIVLDIPSAGLALGGVLLQRYGYEESEQIAAIASGILGVVAFRPTRSNLSHHH